jgi:LPXTG-site transpeptidase (sortase) family protein
MAAPMVTGAFAILRQADPGLTASELESLIVDMSGKSANYRLPRKGQEAHTFDYSRKVLDFSDIEKYIAPVKEPDHDPGFWHLDMEVLPRTGFSAVRPQKLNAVPKDLKYEPLEMILEIPSLDVLSEIVEVPVLDNEYQVTWLGDSVGLLEGSALPGTGTSILAAHNHLNNTEIGPFALLSTMEEGERIFIRDKNNDLQIFIVYANVKVSETDFEAVDQIAEAFGNTLIMITCEDETVSGGYANRRIVAARKIR